MRRRGRRARGLLGVGLLLLTLSCKSIFAPDEGELRGYVLDDLGRRMAGARVSAEPGSRAVTTDSGGFFIFRGLSTGTYTVRATKRAYESSAVRATLPETGGLSCATPGARSHDIRISLEGWSAYQDGRWADAVSRFEDALSDDPDCVDASNGLGWCHARRDSLDQAVAGFQAALVIEGAFLDAHAGLALVSSALNDHLQVIASARAVLDEAGDAYEFRRDASVTSADLRLVLAQSYFHRGEYAEAQDLVDLLDPANGLSPDDPDTWWVEGVQYATYEEALLVELQVLGGTV